MDRISGIIVFLLGVGILWEGRHLPTGSLRAPGPGFFPDFLAVIMVIFSLFFFVGGGKKEHKGNFLFVRSNIKVLIVFVAMLAYFFFFEYLGFVVTSILLMIFLFMGMGSQKWYKAVLESLISIGLVYLLFEILLKSQLPKGIFGF